VVSAAAVDLLARDDLHRQGGLDVAAGDVGADDVDLGAGQLRRRLLLRCGWLRCPQESRAKRSCNRPRVAAPICVGRYICLNRAMVRLADRERLLASLHANAKVAADVAVHARDRVDVDQRAAVDLPEHLRIELVDQLLDRAGGSANPCPAWTTRSCTCCPPDVEHFLDRDEAELVALRRGDPAQVLLARAAGLGERAQQAVEAGRALAALALRRSIVVARRAGENGFIT
jgi:hypothetical protein